MLEQLKDIIVNYVEVKKEDIKPESRFIEDLGFTSFDFPYALTGGGPVRATEVIGILIYNDAFKNMRFSVANAEVCILFIVVAVFSLTQLQLTGKGGEKNEKDQG